jgi:hypothetical protein
MANNSQLWRSNGYDPEALAGFIKRVEAFQAEIDELALEYKEKAAPYREEIAGIKREAHDQGIPKTELAAVLRKRRLEYKAAHVGDKLDLAERANFDEMIEILERLAKQMGPLGEAALDRARAG